jgi:predicted acyl esterase
MKVLRWLVALAILGALAPGSALGAPQRLCNVPITMSDGVVLRANVYLPAQ